MFMMFAFFLVLLFLWIFKTNFQTGQKIEIKINSVFNLQIKSKKRKKESHKTRLTFWKPIKIHFFQWGK